MSKRTFGIAIACKGVPYKYFHSFIHSPVPVVCSVALTATMNIVCVFISAFTCSSGSEWCGLAIITDLMNTVRVFAGITVSITTIASLSDACCYSDLCQLCHGSFTDEFFPLRVEPFTDVVCWCLFWCLLYYQSSVVANISTNGFKHQHLHFYNHFKHRLSRHISCCWFVAYAGDAPNSWSPSALSMGCLILMLLKQLSSSHSISMVEHTAWGLCRKSPNPFAIPTWLERVFFSRFGTTHWHSQL